MLLAAILVAGTIATISPSFIVETANAEPYYGGMDNNYDKKSHGKDVSVKSIKCNNVNVNVNGLELNVLPPSLTNLLQGDEGERGSGSYGSGSGSYGGGPSGSEGDFKFICINNNDNTVIEAEEPIPPVEECAETDEIEACFEQF